MVRIYLNLVLNKVGDFDKLIILGDILYHGPRNDLPPFYNPKGVIKVINEYKDEPHGEERSDREILEEVLDLTRMYAKRAPRKFEARHALKRLLIALENIQMRGPLTNEHPFIEMHEELFPALEMLCMELESMQWQLL